MVEVNRYSFNNKYDKWVRWKKRFMAHDEREECVVGDKVLIRHSKTFSRRKHFMVKQILEKNPEWVADQDFKRRHSEKQLVTPGLNQLVPPELSSPAQRHTPPSATTTKSTKTTKTTAAAAAAAVAESETAGPRQELSYQAQLASHPPLIPVSRVYEMYRRLFQVGFAATAQDPRSKPIDRALEAVDEERAEKYGDDEFGYDEDEYGYDGEDDDDEHGGNEEAQKDKSD